MSQEKKSIKSFTDLDSWQFGHKLVVSVDFKTRNFPKEEAFALTAQLRRAAVSVTSNIAEVFGRNTVKDRAHFYTMALGSIREVQSQLLVARDVGYMERPVFDELAQQAIRTQKILAGLIKATKKGTVT